MENLDVRHFITAFGFREGYPGGSFLVVQSEQISVAVLVAGGDQLSQPKTAKLLVEILEKLAGCRIVAVAANHPAPEVPSIVPQLLCYVRELRIEIVVPVPGRLVESGIEFASGRQLVSSIGSCTTDTQNGAGPCQLSRQSSDSIGCSPGSGSYSLTKQRAFVLTE